MWIKMDRNWFLCHLKAKWLYFQIQRAKYTKFWTVFAAGPIKKKRCDNFEAKYVIFFFYQNDLHVFIISTTLQISSNIKIIVHIKSGKRSIKAALHGKCKQLECLHFFTIFTNLKIDQYEKVNSLGVINFIKIKSTIKKSKYR